jgi:hypothetical protein
MNRFEEIYYEGVEIEGRRHRFETLIVAENQSEY